MQFGLFPGEPIYGSYRDLVFLAIEQYPYAEFVQPDLKRWAYKEGILPEAHSWEWGPIMQEAARIGLIVQIDARTVYGEGNPKLYPVWRKNGPTD